MGGDISKYCGQPDRVIMSTPRWISLAPSESWGEGEGGCCPRKQKRPLLPSLKYQLTCKLISRWWTSSLPWYCHILPQRALLSSRSAASPDWDQPHSQASRRQSPDYGQSGYTLSSVMTSLRNTEESNHLVSTKVYLIRIPACSFGRGVFAARIAKNTWGLSSTVHFLFTSTADLAVRVS